MSGARVSGRSSSDAVSVEIFLCACVPARVISPLFPEHVDARQTDCFPFSQRGGELLMRVMDHVGILIKTGERIDAGPRVCLTVLGLFALICGETSLSQTPHPPNRHPSSNHHPLLVRTRANSAQRYRCAVTLESTSLERPAVPRGCYSGSLTTHPDNVCEIFTSYTTPRKKLDSLPVLFNHKKVS